MKNILLSAIILSLCCNLATAEDIRGCVKPGRNILPLSSEIDPDEHIFGIKYGITEDEFISKYGKADGYVRLNINTTVMIYGKSIALIFTSKKLDGIRITSRSILDWGLSQDMISSSIFSNIRWELTNGVKEEMTLTRVKEILGEPLEGGKYQWEYMTEQSVVTLGFSHYTDAGESDDAYKVHSLTIRKK